MISVQFVKYFWLLNDDSHIIWRSLLAVFLSLLEIDMCYISFDETESSIRGNRVTIHCEIRIQILVPVFPYDRCKRYWLGQWLSQNVVSACSFISFHTLEKLFITEHTFVKWWPYCITDALKNDKRISSVLNVYKWNWHWVIIHCARLLNRQVKWSVINRNMKVKRMLYGIEWHSCRMKEGCKRM